MRDCLQDQHCRRQIRTTSSCSKKQQLLLFYNQHSHHQPSSITPHKASPQTKRTSSLQFRERAYQEAKINILIERKVLSPVDPERLFKVWICQHLEFWNYPPSRRDTRFHIDSRNRAHSPPTQKSHKNLGSDIRREHIEEPQTLASRWLYLCQGMLRNSNRRRPKYTHFSYSNLCVYIKTS